MANYPTSVSTNANLYIAVNGLQTTLAANILATDTTIQLTSTTSFPTTGLVTIDNAEVVSYTGISGPNLTGCTRGADGTTALPHNTGVTVGATIVAAHHNLLKDEVIAIETALGANLANVFPATPTTGSGNVVLATSPTITSPSLVTPALGTPTSGVMTNVTGLPLTTGVTGVLPNGNTTATSSAVANDIMSRDASVNAKINTIIENFATTVTAAGTTPLTVTSAPIQQFTGTTTQTVTLPDATTLATGYQIDILNRSTGAVTVNNNGGSLQSTVAAATQAIFTCTNTGSANGTWDVSTSSAASGGTVTSVSGTTNQITSTNPTTTPTLAIANPLTLPGAMTAGGNIAMASNKVTGLAAGSANGDAIRYEQVFTTSTVTLLGNLAFNPTSAGVVGTTTNDDASGGVVGQVISSGVSIASAVSATSGTALSITSISLNAGDWDIWAQGAVKSTGASTSIGEIILAISRTNNTFPGNATICVQNTNGEVSSDNAMTNQTPGNGNALMGFPVQSRMSLSGTTTVYIVMLATFSVSTAAFFGSIYARRRR